MDCNKDCWNCPHEGCINMTFEEYQEQNKFDKEELDARNPRVLTADERYNRSEKARACKKRYLQTENGRKKNCEYAKMYQANHPDKAKEYRQRRYQFHKEEILARNKAWNEKNKDKTRKSSALGVWRKRFATINGRNPNDEEINNWSERYDAKVKKKTTKEHNKVREEVKKEIIEYCKSEEFIASWNKAKNINFGDFLENSIKENIN